MWTDLIKMNAAASETSARYFCIVFSRLIATGLKRLSWPKACSMQAPALYSFLAQFFSCSFSLALRTMINAAHVRVYIGDWGYLNSLYRQRLHSPPHPGQGLKEQKMRCIRLFSFSQVRGKRMAVEVSFQMDFG